MSEDARRAQLEALAEAVSRATRAGGRLADCAIGTRYVDWTLADVEIVYRYARTAGRYGLLALQALDALHRADLEKAMAQALDIGAADIARETHGGRIVGIK